MVRSESYPLGVARLQQVFLKQIPPSSAKVKRLRAHCAAVLSEETQKKEKRIIGSSGTIRALAKMAHALRGVKVVEREWLTGMIEQMAELDSEQLLQIPGMEPKRVDLILAGAVCLEACMVALGADIALPTKYSLRDGILAEELRHRKKMRRPLATKSLAKFEGIVKQGEQWLERLKKVPQDFSVEMFFHILRLARA